MSEEREPAREGWFVCELPAQCWIIGTHVGDTVLVRNIGLCDLVRPYVFSGYELAHQFIDKRKTANIERVEGPKTAEEFGPWLGSAHCKYKEAIVDPPNVDGQAPFTVALLP